LKRRSGAKIAHAHRFRHTWTQTALKKKAERAIVQDTMGWSSDAIVRGYDGWVRSETAAAAVPEFAPL
jgi:integrase